MAANRDIEITRGDTYAHLVEFVNQNQAPLDLTGYTARAHIRREAAATTAEAAFTVVIIPLTGEVLLTLTPAQTTALPVLKCSLVWDLELTIGTTVTTPLRGAVTVVQDVTHTP